MHTTLILADAAYETGRAAGTFVGLLVGLLVLALPIFFIYKWITNLRGKKVVWAVLSVVFLGFLAFSIIAGIKNVQATIAAKSAWKPVTTKDGSVTLTVPGNWVAMNNIAPTAQLSLGNERSAEMCALITEKKNLLDLGLEAVDKISMENVQAVGTISADQTEPVTVNGLPGRKHKYSMTIKGTKFSYLRVVLESKSDFHHLTFWTTRAYETMAMPTFEKVLASFTAREGGPQPGAEVTTVPVANPEPEVVAIIATQLGVEEEKVKPEATFNDLGADDLDKVELVMAVEETFAITVDDAVAEKFLTVGNVVDYVKAHATQRSDMPNIPSTLPKRALLSPTFSGGSKPEFSAGGAFVCAVEPQQHYMFTCHHLFGPAGGLTEEVKWDALSDEYPKATAVLCRTESPVLAEGTVLEIPGATAMSESASGLDFAAFKISSPSTADALPLAEEDAKPGDIIFMNSPYIGWTPAIVILSDSDSLSFRYYKTKLQLPGTSGSPLVNQKGEVVGITLGGKTTESFTIGVGNPSKNLRRLLGKAVGLAK